MSNQDGHPLALQEALTIVCADEQGRSWDYHNLLFSDQPNLTEESFSSFAVELSLDLAAFSKCMEAKLPFKNIENDIQDVRNFGLLSNPNLSDGWKIDRSNHRQSVPLGIWSCLGSSQCGCIGQLN